MSRAVQPFASIVKIKRQMVSLHFGKYAAWRKQNAHPPTFDVYSTAGMSRKASLFEGLQPVFRPDIFCARKSPEPELTLYELIE